MPGTKGNLNAMKNGTRLARLKIGELPTKMKRQLASARAYRRDLENAVLDIKGAVSLEDAHFVDQAAAAEIHASVCRWLLREKLESMDVSDVLKCSGEMLKSKDVRNKAMQALGLAQAEGKLIEALYSIDDRSNPPSDSDRDDKTTNDTSDDDNAADRKCERRKPATDEDETDD